MKSGSQLHLSTLDDGDILVWFISRGSSVLNHSHNVHPFGYLAENNVFAVQEWGCGSSDEELASICIRPRILDMLASLLSNYYCILRNIQPCLAVLDGHA
jgi:hypothetical protein